MNVEILQNKIKKQCTMFEQCQKKGNTMFPLRLLPSANRPKTDFNAFGISQGSTTTKAIT